MYESIYEVKIPFENIFNALHDFQTCLWHAPKVMHTKLKL